MKKLFDKSSAWHNLGALAVSRENNLNLIRFVAASLVLITHSFALSTGNPQNEPLRQSLGLTLGSLAVDIFFVASGFLITGSLENSRSLRSFFVARFIRIYPALWAMLILLTFVVGPIVTTLSAAEYFSAKDLYKYILKTATLIGGVSHQLPGVFAELPYPNAVNGSLWTLPYEVRCYILIAFLFWATTSLISMTAPARKLLITSLVSLAILAILVSGPTLRKSSPGIYLWIIFLSGAALYLNRHQIKINWVSTIVATSTLTATGFTEPLRGIFHALYPVIIGYLVISLAFLPSGIFKQYNKIGDYSYGMYIYAFPLQQLLIANLPGITPWMLNLLAFPTSLAFAIFSWHWIEKPALKLKSRISPQGQ